MVISPENGDDQRDESTSLRRCLTRLSLGNGMISGQSGIFASIDEQETHMTAMSPPTDSPSSPIPGRFLDKLKSESPSPPPLSIAIKRRRFFSSVIEEDEQNSDSVLVRKRMIARKLGDEFDRIASEDTLEITNLDLDSVVMRSLNKKTTEREDDVDEAEAIMCDNLQKRLKPKPSRVSRSSPSSPAASRKRISSPRLAMMRR